MKKLILCFVLFASNVISADGIINNGSITYLRAYEDSNDATSIFISINGKQRVGPNPDNPTVNCELWTNTQTVYSLALTAKTTGQKVDIAYIARGDNDEFCKVRYMSLSD